MAGLPLLHHTYGLRLLPQRLQRADIGCFDCLKPCEACKSIIFLLFNARWRHISRNYSSSIGGWMYHRDSDEILNFFVLCRSVTLAPTRVAS